MGWLVEPTPKTRAEMSEFQSSRKRRPLTEEKQHLSENLKGKPHPPRIAQEIKDKLIKMWNSGTYTKQK